MKPFIPQKLPIKDLDYQALAPLVSRATLALGKYDAALERTPNPDMFITSFTRQEALDSNRIEGSQSSLNDILSSEAEQGPIFEEERAEVNSGRSDDLKEIFNYRKALSVAEKEFETNRPFNLTLLKNLHYILLDSVRGQKKARGEFRHLPSHQNWIGKKGSTLRTATFVPPEPSKVFGFLDAWESYYHDDEPDPLVQLAVVHAQFELIHPFLDGNGRTGRMLVPLFLFEKNIITRPAFYISSYLESNRTTYTGLLNQLSARPSKWSDWVKFFLGGIAEQADDNTEKLIAIENLYEELKAKFLDATNSQYAVPVLDAIFFVPVFTASVVVEIMKKNGREILPSTLSHLLRTLATKGLLEKVRVGRGRSKTVYSLDSLVEIISS